MSKTSLCFCFLSTVLFYRFWVDKTVVFCGGFRNIFFIKSMQMLIHIYIYTGLLFFTDKCHQIKKRKKKKETGKKSTTSK